MHYRQFTTQAQAQTYCDQQTALMELPADGETQVWADPVLLADGSYVVPAYEDASAVVWDLSWEIAQAEN